MLLSRAYQLLCKACLYTVCAHVNLSDLCWN